MGKKHDKSSRYCSQYDDYEEEGHNHKKKQKNKKKNYDLDFVGEIDAQKQKANNRYLNKKKDKDKYNRYDDWN